MLKNFRAYQLAIQLYKSALKVDGPERLVAQLLDAASSIGLNLAEGSERVTAPDRRRFFRIAMGSARECQAALEMLPDTDHVKQLRVLADQVGANVFRLCQSLDRQCKDSTVNVGKATLSDTDV